MQQAREEVIAESKKEKDDAAADLALIGAAQRVEHYEMAGYSTARNLAQQLHHSAIVQHLSRSLAEEENADQLLNQVARPLMSAAKMPARGRVDPREPALAAGAAATSPSARSRRLREA